MIRHIVIAALLASASVPLHATTYTLEPDYTQGVFRWNHLGFSSPAAQFSQGKGTLEFDEGYPTRASIAVTIPLDTLHTGVPDLDDDFKSDSFFDLAKYPTATFKSTQVTRGHTSNELEVTGDLTLHGVTKPVTLHVKRVKVGINPRSQVPTVGFDAMATLRRSDFGLGRYVPQVGDEIQIQLVCQAADAKAYAEFLKAQEKEKK